MPEYLSPGVYVEEIDAGPKPIAGVSTSTAGMVGVTSRGPTTGKPELVTSFAEFTRKFGGFLTPPSGSVFNKWAVDPSEGGRWWWFPLSVKGFFDNGGQRLYVKRVFASTSLAASAVLGKGLVADVVADAASGQRVVKLEHLFGLDNGTALKFFNGETGAQIGGAFAVASYDPATTRITVDSNLPAEVLATRGDFAEIKARSGAPVPTGEATLEFTAISRGAWGNDLRVQTRPDTELALNILHDQTVGGNAVTRTVVSVTGGTAVVVEVNDIAGLANNDRVQIQGREYTISAVETTTKKFEISPAPGTADFPPAGSSVRRLRKANNTGANTINVFGASQLYPGALVELDNGTDKEYLAVDSVTGDAVKLSAALGQTYFEGHRLRVLGISVTIQHAPGDTVEVEENFGPLRLHDDGSNSYLVTQVNLRSQLVRVRTRAGFSTSDLAKFPTGTSGLATKFAGGDDKLGDLAVEDFVGVDSGSGKRTGIQSLEDIDEVSICMVPNVWSGTVRSALITHCEVLKDRFAIVDPQDGLSIEGIRTAREPIDTKYGAIYYPWVVVRDPLSRRNVNLAPSGHMAGIYARTDVERGVHKAPANAVIRGITELAQDVTKREQDMLNPKGINVLRYFPGMGNRVWGARTLTSDQSWKYINVRRLFLMVEESIDEGTQWVVFEPNDEPLWARVRQSVSNFLTTVWRSGALEGATTEEAFFVACDRTTMTQDDIDNGRLICLIGIAPVKPAEFVIFRIQQKTRELQPA